MKKTLLIVLLFACYISSQSQFSNTWSVKLSNAIITRWPGTIDDMTSKGWEYSNSIVLHGMEKVYMGTPTLSYINYVKKYVEKFVDSSGNTITGLAQNLDKIHPGILCLFLYEKTGYLKFKTAATKLRNYLITGGYPKTPNGGYWHKNNGSYDNIMMADGIYMAHPFLAKYGSIFNDNIALDTAINQTLMLASYLQTSSHLLKHAWNYPKTATWCDPTTGISKEVWSRGMGWYVMAVVDILKYVPPAHPKYTQLKNILIDLAIGIQATQDPGTGLWYQVVDKGGSAGNYIETSGSAMFIYALKTGVNYGWISSSYATVAQNGWTGLVNNKLTTIADGPKVNDFAPAMGVQTNYSAYVGIASVDCPTTTNPHGYAAILMAGSVMEFPFSLLPIKFSVFTAWRKNNSVLLNWQNSDNNEASDFVIERSINGIDFVRIATVATNKSATYLWTDHSALASTSYYRIKASSMDGAVYYSSVVIVKGTYGETNMLVSPNPVTNRSMNIVFNNLKIGTYSVQVLNNSGELIASKSFQAKEGRLEKLIHLPPGASKGIYSVQLKGAGNITIHKLIVVE